jgi:hypothetical protein
MQHIRSRLLVENHADLGGICQVVVIAEAENGRRIYDFFWCSLSKIPSFRGSSGAISERRRKNSAHSAQKPIRKFQQTATPQKKKERDKEQKIAKG